MQGNQDGGLVGVDVSKGWPDICMMPGGGVERIANDPETISSWIARVRREGLWPRLVAMEPTGGYERMLCRALAAASIRFVKLHPNTILAFRKAQGLRAKTDRIDAMLIARYLAEAEARGALPKAFPNDERLAALSARRRQLVEARMAERCRIDLASEPIVRESLALIVEALSRSLDAIDDAIRQHIRSRSELARLDKALQAIRGIGPLSAAVLVAHLPELGHLTGKEIAALVGLAPQTNESGKTRRRAATGHGRPIVRAALFNAARAAIRHPSPMRDFYERLVVVNRRPGKVALTAIMRKILVAANAVARDLQISDTETLDSCPR